MVGGGWWWWVWVAGSGGGRPLEDTGGEASSRAQILARPPESSPLLTPPGPLKLRLLEEQKSNYME